MKSNARKVRAMLSEQALAEIESISIKLESGQTAKFDVAKELAISHDPTELNEQALTAHARFAFWEYQAARAMRILRDKETDLARLEGDLRYRYSKVLKEEDRYTPAATVEGTLAGDDRVLRAKNELNQLREHWTILRTMADAHGHRSHLLRRLLAKDHDATRG